MTKPSIRRAVLEVKTRRDTHLPARATRGGGGSRSPLLRLPLSGYLLGCDRAATPSASSADTLTAALEVMVGGEE